MQHANRVPALPLALVKAAGTYLASLLAPLCASAAITVNYYNFEFDYSEIQILPGQIYLEDVAPSQDYPSASIRNLLHHSFADECLGDSQIGFVRHRYTVEDCAYFFRASDIGAQDPANGEYYAVENWGRVYWMGDNDLVDGATWGSDNYVLMRDLATGQFIAVLQLNFDQITGLASLLASAIDLDGLTYSPASPPSRPPPSPSPRASPRWPVSACSVSPPCAASAARPDAGQSKHPELPPGRGAGLLSRWALSLISFPSPVYPSSSR